MSGLKRQVRRAGFTIIELMTVIVVIGILASIAVVSYNGAQERARNTSRLSAVKQMEEVVQVVLTKKTPLEVRGALTFSNGWYKACLGMGYKDINNNGVGDCAYYGDEPYASETTALNAMLKDYAELPSMSAYPPSIATDGDVVAGPYLSSAWADSKEMLVIQYSLEGIEQKCKFAPLVYFDGGSTWSMTPFGGGSPDYTVSANGVTECMLFVTDEL